MPNMLNASQTAEFNEKGFTYARGLFAPDEVKLLTRAMEEDPAVRGSILDRRDGDDAFEHPRDQRRRDAIVAIAPLLGDRDEPGLDELEQVLAGGRTRDAGEISKFAAGQRLTAHQGS